MRWLWSLVLAGWGSSVWAQEPAPVPQVEPEPSTEPGFETVAPLKKKRPSADPESPVIVPEQGPNERLIEDVAATRGEVSLGELVDEILADVVAELDRRPLKRLSPMALREISLGSNVNSGFARKLRSALVTQLHTGTKIRVVRCIECEATRTRIDGNQWIITKGLTSVEELRQAAARIGAKSFLDVSFGFEPETGVVEMDFVLIDAEDAQILWADTFRADETTPMLLRSSEAPLRRKDRLRDLEMLLEGRPYYGLAASAGFALIPYDDPVAGDIGGATAGFRVYERFGVDRRIMFGLDIMGFFNPSRLAGGILSAGCWWIPIRPDFIHPELRVGGKGGAFLAGSEGNAAVFQLGAEVLLRYRFGLYAYALFMTKSQFNGSELGGLGFTTGLSFNW